MNFRLVERLRADPATSVNRLRRFAEVEFGIGIAIFFAAASLTSVPPAVDLTRDRVSWEEIAQRNTPEWPRLTSPDHDVLAIPALQAKLDAEAAARKAAPQIAFIPGAGSCRRETPTTSRGPSTITTGPASSSSPWDCWRC